MSKGFTLIELLVVVLILGILTAIALPSYLSSVYSARQSQANANARLLAAAVQVRGIRTGAYDSVLTDYTADIAGSLPMNPCTGTTTGFTITVNNRSATITASAGSQCGTWTPSTFAISM